MEREEKEKRESAFRALLDDEEKGQPTPPLTVSTPDPSKFPKGFHPGPRMEGKRSWGE